MKTKEYKKFTESIDNLLKLNKSNRLKYKTETCNIDPIYYALEFCTVKCDIGRRVGKTKYIQQNAKKGDLVVVANERIKTLYKRVKFEFDVLTIDYIIKSRSREFQFKNIYIDEPIMVFRNRQSLDEFYIIMVQPKIEQTFIFLGR